MHRVRMAMATNFTEGVRWLYGPVGIIAVIRRYDSVGICAGPTYTDNAGMRWLGRGLPRPIDIPRLIDKFRLADEAHPI